MADTDKKEDQVDEADKPEELPVAVEDDDDDKKEDADKDDVKEDDKKKKMPMFDRKPKPHPGDHYKDQFKDKIHPKGTPSIIEFKWPKNVREMKDCDTLCMIYLIQCACELHRKRTIERNKYFDSISRSDRFISHVCTPNVVTNFINWHNEDKEKNVFTGDMIKSKKKLFIINDMISEVGGVLKGPATRIFSKLTQEVMIEYDTWTETGNTKLKLETWGLTKLYASEPVLEECTVEQVVTLFTFRAKASPPKDDAKDDEKDENDDKPMEPDPVNGVFAQFELVTNSASEKLRKVENWQDKLVEWIREQNIDGKTIKNTPGKEQ